MNLSRVALLFLTGYGVVGLIVVIVAWLHDHEWFSGFIMLGLSAPVTVLYFFLLLALRHFGFQSQLGMFVAGGLCAAFPALCGFFPVYFFRLKYAILLIIGQMGLLVLIVTVLSRINTKWLPLFRG